MLQFIKNIPNKRLTQIAIVCTVLFSIWGGVRAYNDIVFERAVGGHLKLAADANSIELAEAQLIQAVDGMNALNLCNEGGQECFTSVFWRTPDEDVGFWRQNVEASLADLRAMPPEERANNLIESNQLIKIRESLIDHGQRGVSVTQPSGIDVYPHNFAFFWWGALSCLGAVVFGAARGIRFLMTDA